MAWPSQIDMFTLMRSSPGPVLSLYQARCYHLPSLTLHLRNALRKKHPTLGKPTRFCQAQVRILFVLTAPKLGIEVAISVIDHIRQVNDAAVLVELQRPWKGMLFARGAHRLSAKKWALIDSHAITSKLHRSSERVEIDPAPVEPVSCSLHLVGSKRF